MSYLSKCASRLTTATFAAALALSLAPPGLAQSAVQAPGDSSGTSSSATSPSTQQQLDDLQKEMAALEQQIAALKAQANAAPSVQAASYSVQTTPAPAAQAPAPAATPAAAPSAINLAGLLGAVTLSGVGDVYYGYNYNHPLDNYSGFRFFDGPTNGFGLNMAEVILDRPPDSAPTTVDGRFGYHFSAGYGNAAQVVNCSDIANFDVAADSACSNFYVKEAYASYLAPVGKGLTITVGKFVTPVGNEVIETNGNWNYSRSLLFYYAIPYFHFGASAKYAWNPKIAATFYLVNGWNNSVISHEFGTGQSSGLTYGTSIAYTPNAKWAVTENYFAGPVTDAYADYDDSNTTTVNDWKQLSDTIIAYTPNAKWAFALNGDYGFGPRNYNVVIAGGATAHPEALPAGVTQVGPMDKWWGAAGYAKYTMSPKAYFAVRYEY
jgi:putative OmpL-like beta-barrel porin-2